MEPFAFALSAVTAGFGLIVALYAVHLAISTRIECRAMKESTHAVQYVPFDPTKDPDDESADAANALGEREDYENVADIHEREEPLN